MKTAITVGHSILKNGLCTSADGLFNEYQYCKTLAHILADILIKEGYEVDVIICPEREFTSKTQEKNYKLSRVNRKKYDLVIELHLNSYNGTAKGTEVLYFNNTGKMYAQRVVNRLGTVFTSRGVKDRPDFDTDYQRLKNVGVPIVAEPHIPSPRVPEEIGWKRVVFKGLDGELIEIRG